jgi:TonB family protein
MKSIVAVLALVSCVLISQADLRAVRTNPVPVETPTPGYPASLTDTGKSGQAVVEMTITEEGRVENPVLRSAEDPAFGEAALAAVVQWRFQPATRDGVAVASKVALPFEFKAPVEQQFNAMLGRKVFVDLPPDTKVLTRAEHGGDLRPSRRVPPQLPKSLQGKGIEEIIRVRLIVNPEGDVINPAVEGNPQHPELIGPALALVSMWKYPPPVKDNQPVYVSLVTQLRYSDNPQAPAAGKGGAPAPKKQ